MQNFFKYEIFGNTVLHYCISLGIFFITFIAIVLCRKILLRRLEKWAEKTATGVDDFLLQVIDKKLLPVGYVVAFYLGIQGLKLNPIVHKAVNILLLVLLTVLGIRFLMAVIIYGIETFWIKREEDVSRQHALKIIVNITKVIVWGLAIAVLLDNLGVKITPLVAGLGIGGVAVALAARAILSDLFSCFCIYFDRPFEIGDFIIVGDYLGVVEYIGIKTTRLRSLSGEQVVFSNTDLTNSRVRNYKRMERRRVVFKIGVTYQTDNQHLKEISTIITGIIKSIEDTVFDRAHFFAFGDFSLVFEVVYYVLSSDYNKYMDIQQEINIRMKEEFEKRGIEFAYPTQTLYLSRQ